MRQQISLSYVHKACILYQLLIWWCNTCWLHRNSDNVKSICQGGQNLTCRAVHTDPLGPLRNNKFLKSPITGEVGDGGCSESLQDLTFGRTYLDVHSWEDWQLF